MQMMLGVGNRFEADILRQLGDLDHIVDHLLPTLRMHRDRTQPLSLFERGREGGQEKIYEFHSSSPFRAGFSFSSSRIFLRVMPDFLFFDPNFLSIVQIYLAKVFSFAFRATAFRLTVSANAFSRALHPNAFGRAIYMNAPGLTIRTKTPLARRSLDILWLAIRANPIQSAMNLNLLGFAVRANFSGRGVCVNVL